MIAALFIKRSDALGMIYLASDRDNLMFCAGLPEEFYFFETIVNDANITGIRKRDSSAEPIFLFDSQHLLERELLALTFNRKCKFFRCDIIRFKSFDIASDTRALERIPVNQFSIQFLSVATKG